MIKRITWMSNLNAMHERTSMMQDSRLGMLPKKKKHILPLNVYILYRLIFCRYWYWHWTLVIKAT